MEPVRIAAVGDIMLGDSPQVFGFGVGSAIERHGGGFPFRHVAAELRGHDLTFGNLEIVISGYDPRVTPFAGQVYRAQPCAVEGLVDAGFDVLAACTNHTMQHGQPALDETCDLLASRGIVVTGLEIPERGIRNLVVLQRKHLTVGFLGYNFRPPQYFLDAPAWKTPDFDLIAREVSTARERADVVVVSLHWGEEFIDQPTPDQVDLARRLVDQGVDVILGHHSHMVQGVERYRHGVIAYSLGNFVFDQWQARLRRSMILRLTIHGPKSIDYEVVPVEIDRAHQPRVPSGNAYLRARKEIEDLAQAIGSTGAGAHRAAVRQRLKQFRREVYLHYVTHVFRYPPRHLVSNLVAAVKRRTG